MSDHVHFEIDAAGVASITIDRPEKRNAIDESMMKAIVDGLAEAERDPGAKVVLLRANGGTFCSGFDLSDPERFWGPYAAQGQRGVMLGMRDRADVMRKVLYSMKPVVAEVAGDCIGVGLYFVLLADLAVVADDASFGLPEERFGAAGTSWLYPFLLSQCGLKVTNEIMLTGRRLEAQELLQWRLVNRVVPRDAVAQSARDACTAICSLPREGIASGRLAAHLSFDTLGLGSSFTPHYALLPHVAALTREPDEFDFHQAVAERGVKEAVKERDERFAGDYWRW